MLNKQDYLLVGPGVEAEIADWVMGELPPIPSLWKSGPLHLERQSDPDEALDDDAPDSTWKTVTFLPYQTVKARLITPETLIICSEEGGCKLQTRGGLHLYFWGEASRAALYLGLIEAVKSRNAIMLHACSYIPSGETGLRAVVGRSGAGKSTHLLRQVEAGARPVSEDMLWLNLETGECTSTDKHVRLLPGNTHAPTDIADAHGESPGGIKELWQITWERENIGSFPNLETIYCLENYEAKPLSSLSPISRTQYLWEALGQPVLPETRRAHELWVSSVVMNGSVTLPVGKLGG